MRPVSKDEFDGRKAVEDERFARDKARLDKHEDQMDDLMRLTVQMGELLKRHDESIDKHDRRISDIERQPVDTLSKVKTAIITTIVSGAVGAALAFVLSNINK